MLLEEKTRQLQELEAVMGQIRDNSALIMREVQANTRSPAQSTKQVQYSHKSTPEIEDRAKDS